MLTAQQNRQHVLIIHRTESILVNSAWIQGSLASCYGPDHDTIGLVEGIDEIDPTDPDACAFCLEGAMHLATHELLQEGSLTRHVAPGTPEHSWLDVARRDIGERFIREYCCSMPDFNDQPGRTHDEVIAIAQDFRTRLSAPSTTRSPEVPV